MRSTLLVREYYLDIIAASTSPVTAHACVILEGSNSLCRVQSTAVGFRWGFIIVIHIFYIQPATQTYLSINIPT